MTGGREALSQSIRRLTVGPRGTLSWPPGDVVWTLESATPLTSQEDVA